MTKHLRTNARTHTHKRTRTLVSRWNVCFNFAQSKTNWGHWEHWWSPASTSCFLSQLEAGMSPAAAVLHERLVIKELDWAFCQLLGAVGRLLLCGPVTNL